MNREPVVTIASIQAVVVAVVAALVAFGVDLTQDQTAAILGVTSAVLAIVFAVWQRSKVSPS